MFYESWEYTDPKTKNTVEYPPLIKDDDEDGFLLDNAVPLIRGVHASNEFHKTFYPYMKSCFEDRSLELLSTSEEVDSLYKNGEITAEQYAQHIEHDILQSELSNIKMEMFNMFVLSRGKREIELLLFVMDYLLFMNGKKKIDTHYLTIIKVMVMTYLMNIHMFKNYRKEVLCGNKK